MYDGSICKADPDQTVAGDSSNSSSMEGAAEIEVLKASSSSKTTTAMDSNSSNMVTIILRPYQLRGLMGVAILAPLGSKPVTTASVICHKNVSD